MGVLLLGMKEINGGSMDVRGEYCEGGEKRGAEGGGGGWGRLQGDEQSAGGKREALKTSMIMQ